MCNLILEEKRKSDANSYAAVWKFVPIVTKKTVYAQGGFWIFLGKSGRTELGIKYLIDAMYVENSDLRCSLCRISLPESVTVEFHYCVVQCSYVLSKSSEEHKRNNF